MRKLIPTKWIVYAAMTIAITAALAPVVYSYVLWKQEQNAAG
jgi:hypothetical protein